MVRICENVFSLIIWTGRELEIQQLALIGPSSTLNSEACSNLRVMASGVTWTLFGGVVCFT